LKTLRLFTDGASKGNPGDSGLGVVIEDDRGTKLEAKCKWLGTKTNNQAEYLALIEGLKIVSAWAPDRLEIRLDSKLVVEQIKGNWRIKEPALKGLHEQAKKLLEGLGVAWDIAHVDREQNRRADFLANKAIAEHVREAGPGG
jgi:ribonuclease HI